MSHDRRRFALPSQPLIGSDLHIWCAALDGPAAELAYFHSLLSADEKERAKRFYFERDRNRYVFARGILRTLLAAYLDVDASGIAFNYGPQRKPELAMGSGDKTLQFNLAHSNEWAAYIFGWDRPVGIDLEKIRPVSDVDDLVQRFFSPRESALIRSLSGQEKWDTFFQIWTCKEAILKAHGSGLTTPLDQFEISLGESDVVTIHSVAMDSAQLAEWKLQVFERIPGYKSAIAVHGHLGRVAFESFGI